MDMQRLQHLLLRAALALGCAVPLAAAAADVLPVAAAAADVFDNSAANLLVVLRETPGANKQDEALRPLGKVSATLPDGRQIEFETSWFAYLGDIHLRLVFDGERRVQSASPDDLTRLQLTPEEALARAVDNLRRRYGAPVAQPWAGGLMQVQGGAPELNSSYLLDRGFWQELLRQYPEGVVAAVPRRGGLVFAPVSDAAAMFSLQFSAAALYAGDERSRLSSALYLFKEGRWSVYQPPQVH